MEPFKNQFSYLNACRIAESLEQIYPAFSMPKFCKGLEDALEPLELKQRMQLLADRIEAGLPTHPPELFSILVKTLADDEADNHGLRNFLVWPLTEIVARRGQDHFEPAMHALSEMTNRFTAEWAIRPFLRTHRERTLAHLLKWCAHPDEHVRRLVSEGSRPLLPWGERLPDLLNSPFPTLVLLDRLYQDPSDYVRLSVSNHLNDFSKHHPELVLETLTRWRKNAQGNPQFEKLARHACRTLIKNGHAGALAFHGFGNAKSLGLDAVELKNPTLRIGDRLSYRLMVKNLSNSPQRVLFDYAILHQKANGQRTPKVFKGRTRELTAGEIWEIEGQHSFKIVTTRVYHPGDHGFEVRLNGKAFPSVEFMLND